MKVPIGNLTFDHASYDKEGDVLYLHAGESAAATESEETPEGHVLRYGREGNVVGLTIINARWLIDREGGVTVTLPEARRVEAEDLEPAFTS